MLGMRFMAMVKASSAMSLQCLASYTDLIVTSWGIALRLCSLSRSASPQSSRGHTCILPHTYPVTT
jgi:hypothetical protein